VQYLIAHWAAIAAVLAIVGAASDVVGHSLQPGPWQRLFLTLARVLPAPNLVGAQRAATGQVPGPKLPLIPAPVDSSAEVTQPEVRRP
jgi:hypothetical protein